MSLINDALKKAQSMHAPAPKSGLKLASKPAEPTASPAPATSGIEPPPARTPNPRPAGKSNPTTLLFLGAGTFLAAFCILGTIAFFLLREGQKELGATTNAVTVAEAKPQPPPEEPKTHEAAPKAETLPPATTSKPPQANPAEAQGPQPDVAPPTTGEATEPIGESTALVAAAPEKPAPPPRPAAPTRPRDHRLLSFALTLHVSGIRTGDNPKALINNRVYSLGEYISPDYDLRLAKIDLRQLELADSFGNFYEVRF